MTPQFLRSEAARFREMAESVDREASRQRLLAMAVDYEERAAEADKNQPPAPPPLETAAESEPEAEQEPASDEAIRVRPGRKRLSLRG
jgi:hypothetical protein